jgi:hypothetical protein
MGNKPSRVRQSEIQAAIRGARKEGAKKVEIRISSEASVIIPLVEDEQKPIADEKEITL